jgi:hypothetical protein
MAGMSSLTPRFFEEGESFLQMTSNQNCSCKYFVSIDGNGCLLEEYFIPDHQATESMQEKVHVTSRNLSLQTKDVYYSGNLFSFSLTNFLLNMNCCHCLKT